MVVVYRNGDEHTVKVHFGDVVLYAGEMYWAVFSAADAVSCALFSVVADFGADGRERVVAEEDLSGLHEFVLFEELDDLRNGCVNRAAFLAQRFFAVEAAFGFGDDMQWHGVFIPLEVSV